MPHGKLLIVDDNKSVLKALNIFLQYEFDVVKCISNPNQIHSEFQKANFDVVLLDMNFAAGLNTGNEGFFWLHEIKKISPDTEVIMFTAYGDVELAVRAVKEGAADFVLKPWDNEKMVATLKSAYRLCEAKKEISNLKSRQVVLKQELNPEKKLVVGTSPAMLKIMKLIGKIAETDANVLITGENGTGKEIIASEIHRLSKRNKELMVTVDMGSIPENLFESELFGHKKGAFTDAIEDRTGKFELANGGTLFLDEIGNLPLNLQSKLLVVLQNRQITPVGGSKNIPVDIRLISATNCQIDDLVANGHFRQDLLYRINTIHIEIPSLRERIEDIESLAIFFLKKYARKYNRVNLQMNQVLISKLKEYHWPGNIRELEHTIEKAVILSDGLKIKSDDIMFKPVKKIVKSGPATIEEMEKQMIINALEKNEGNYSIAAEQLGITRQTLYNKTKKYGI
ncbi:MAG: sigma-54 dependent transcriptional regulator [Bacteroidales bacterium]